LCLSVIIARIRTRPVGEGKMARKGNDYGATTKLLKTVPMFATCTKKQLGAIAGISKVVEHDSGRLICREGESGAAFHVIVEGETKVQIGGRTRRRLGPGAFFGEIALLDGGPRSATVIAETPVRTLSVPVFSFRSLLRADPSLSLKMLEEVCRRMRGVDTSLHA